MYISKHHSNNIVFIQKYCLMGLHRNPVKALILRMREMRAFLSLATALAPRIFPPYFLVYVKNIFKIFHNYKFI
jgi:hypothetical protein